MLPWRVGQAFIFTFQWFFTQATKRDRYLFVEDSCTIHNLWSQQWILVAADDT